MASRTLIRLAALLALVLPGCPGEQPTPGDAAVRSDAGRADAGPVLDSGAGGDAEPWEADAEPGAADARAHPDAHLGADTGPGRDAQVAPDAGHAGQDAGPPGRDAQAPADASPGAPDAASIGPFTISGNAGVAFASVNAGGRATTAGATGDYLLEWMPAGSYQVTPVLAGCTFSPSSRAVVVGPDAAGQGFSASCSSAPAPAPISIPYALGAYYMPKPRHPSHQWAELRMFNAKDQIKPGGQRMPLMGYYQGDSPTVLDWQIKWAVDRGIVYFVFDDYWTDSNPAPLYQGPLQALLAAPHRASLQFAVALWQNATGGSTGAAMRARFLGTILPYYVAHYLSQPNYLLVDGKPAIYFGERHLVFGNDSTDADIASTLASADAYIASTTSFSGATWIVTSHNSYSVDFSGAKAAGLQVVSPYYVLPGVYPYNNNDIVVTPDVNLSWPPGKPYSSVPGYANTEHQLSFAEAAARSMKFIPSTTSDFDTRWAWWNTNHLYFSGQNQMDFWNMLGQTRALVDANSGATAIATRSGKPMVGLGAWNEWAESSSLEPGYAAVAANDNHDPFFYATAAAKQFGGPSSGYDTSAPGDMSLGFWPRDTWTFSSTTGSGPEFWLDSNVASTLTVGAGDVGVLTLDGVAALETPTSVQASGYRQLKILLAVASGGPLSLLQLRWQSNSYSDGADAFGAPAEPGHRSFDHLYGHSLQCTPSGAFCEYTFDLQAIADWQGRLRVIELRLQGATRPTQVLIKRVWLVP